MPRITVTMLEGRSLEQKRALVKGFVDLCEEVLKVPKERITVAFTEYSEENLAPGGLLWCDRDPETKYEIKT